MRIYKWATIVTGLISITCFLGILTSCRVTTVFYDLVLGVFASGFLSFLISFIGYFAEKRKTMERFHRYTDKLIKQINRYNQRMTLEDKVNFFVNFYDSEDGWIEWDLAYGDICFIIGFRHKKYIHEKIYKPVQNIVSSIYLRYCNFKWHQGGVGRNESVMQDFINEIEGQIYDISKITVNSFDDRKPPISCVGTAIHNKTHPVLDELRGRYRKIMYWPWSIFD